MKKKLVVVGMLAAIAGVVAVIPERFRGIMFLKKM